VATPKGSPPPPPRMPAVSVQGGIGLSWETLGIAAAVGALYYEFVVKPRQVVSTTTTVPTTTKAGG